jgi:hypothetical protein
LEPFGEDGVRVDKMEICAESMARPGSLCGFFVKFARGIKIGEMSS